MWLWPEDRETERQRHVQRQSDRIQTVTEMRYNDDCHSFKHWGVINSLKYEGAIFEKRNYDKD